MGWDHVIWIYGEPASAKNQRRIVKFGDRPALIKSEKALNYAEAFNQQCPVLDELLEGDISMRIDGWYASRRPDLACEEIISDLLQKKIYKNDRQVKARMAVWNLDRKDPRCRIAIKELPVSGFENVSLHYSLNDLFGAGADDGRDGPLGEDRGTVGLKKD